MADSDARLPLEFAVIGVNHHHAALEEREALAKAANDARSFLAQAANLLATKEVVLLATCNRFELYSLSVDPTALEKLRQDLAQRIAKPEAIFVLRGRAAIEHLFRVSSSLDSMVLGEAQILGQVKDAYRQAVQAGFAGRYIHHWFQFAFSVAKKVRSGTQIAERGVSLSYVAVKLAQQIFGELSSCRVLIVGSGKMAELAALHLRRYGCSEIIVANRTIEHAAQLADRIGGSAVALSELVRLSARVDVIIGSITIDKPLLEYQMLQGLRREKPLFLIDLGVPRNFSASLGEIDDVFLYNLDDLAQIAAQNLEFREHAAKEAELILQYSLQQFEAWLQRLRAEPMLLGMRQRIHDLCGEELQRAAKPHLHSGALSPEQLQLLNSELSHRLSQKLAHEIGQLLLQMPSRELLERAGLMEGSTLAPSSDATLESLLPLVVDEFLWA
jgi:glutamyl-tRNA reductase